MNLQFNHDSLKTIDSRDLMNFISYLFKQELIQRAEKMYVNTSFIEQVNELNCRVTIKLQYWNKDETGEGHIRYWSYQRANDFSCTNGASWQPFPLPPIKK